MKNSSPVGFCLFVDRRNYFLLPGLVNDPDKKDLLKDLMASGQLSNEMKTKLLEEITKKPINSSTLLDVLKQSSDMSPEMLDKVLKSVEKMSAKELSELAKNLDNLPPAMKQRVMQEMMKNLKNLDSKTQASILREMLRNSVDMDPKVVADLIVNSVAFPTRDIVVLFDLLEKYRKSHTNGHQRTAAQSR